MFWVGRIGCIFCSLKSQTAVIHGKNQFKCSRNMSLLEKHVSEATEPRHIEVHLDLWRTIYKAVTLLAEAGLSVPDQ